MSLLNLNSGILIYEVHAFWLTIVLDTCNFTLNTTSQAWNTPQSRENIWSKPEVSSLFISLKHMHTEHSSPTAAVPRACEVHSGTVYGHQMSSAVKDMCWKEREYSLIQA